MYEIIDGMVNIHDEEIRIWADLSTAQYIEDCSAYLTDEEGNTIKTGTYNSVVEWAYRRGYIF